jgi:hypothetical protein
MICDKYARFSQNILVILPKDKSVPLRPDGTIEIHYRITVLSKAVSKNL